MRLTLRRSIFAILALALPSLAAAQGVWNGGQIISSRGTPVPSVTVSVCAEPVTISSGQCSPLATLYPDVTLTNYTISSAARSSNFVTITTSTSHRIVPNTVVSISGVSDPSFNGTFTVASASSNSFGYSQVGSNSSSSGGSVGGANPFTGDSYGNYFFYAAPGTYAVQFSSPQIQPTYFQRNVVLVSGTVYAPGSNQQMLYNNNGPLGATTGIVTDGANVAFNDSATITSTPPSLAGSNTGWKFCFYSTTYCEGIATDTKVNLLPYWFSIFSSNPLNNATSTAPDGNAKISLGANSTIVAPEISTPSNPPSGIDVLFLNSSTHQLSCLTSSGGSCLSSSSSGVTEATWSPYDITVNTAGIQSEMSLPQSHTLEAFYAYALTAGSGCSTYPTVAFYDESSSTALASMTFTSGQYFADSGLSVAMTGGHNFSIRVTTAGSGCSTPPENVQFTVVYK